jgi:hypothetical protein
MFEYFTDGARRILVLAQVEARNLHDSSIGPEHLLLGMLREGECIAAKALSDAGADYYRARAVIEEHKHQQTGRGTGPEPLSKATIRVMERSLQISWAQADGGIDTEHLLVALLEQEDETTEAVLAGLDVTPEEVVQRVDALLAERTLLVNPVLASPLPSALALALGGDRSKQLEVLEGVLWGIDHLDEVVELLRGSANRRAARDALMAPPFELSQNQATGALDLRVDSVTVERRQQVVGEIEVLRRKIFED